MSKVIISNGFNKFHLAVAAVEAHRRGLLSLLITGAYPTPAVRWLASSMGHSGSRKMDRLLARGEAIPDALVRPMWLSEGIQQAVRLTRRLLPFAGAWAAMNRYSFRLYARQAVKHVRNINPPAQIYHYRAGFGHESVQAAKELGMIALCDHSIAHPAVLEYLVAHQGRLPSPGTQGAMSSVWKDILHDIEQSDAVLVNSDFVKETFVHQGWDPARVHVIYWGIDEQFLDSIPPDAPESNERDARTRILFAGALERRKGAATLLAAVENIGDAPWRLEIVGGTEPDIKREFGNELRDPRIEIRGILPRRELVSRMVAADVFVFPSLAEGSARVVFEALACGCYVITTPNTGSIVEDGIHGALVPPGDADALAGAIRRAIADRDMVADIGRRNAALMHDRYRQSGYGDGLAQLYGALAQL